MSEPTNFKIAQYVGNALNLDFSKVGFSEGVKKFFSSIFKSVLAVMLAAGLNGVLDNLNAYQSTIAGHEQETIGVLILVIRALISGGLHWVNTLKKDEVVLPPVA